MRGPLPDPLARKLPRQPTPPVLFEPRWAAQQDVRRTNAGELATMIAAILSRTVWEVYQLRPTHRRVGRGDAEK